MKNKLLGILICGISVLGLTGCNNILDERNISYDDLNEVNNKIIEYFTLNGVDDYENYSYNYVDDKNRVVVVGLLDNSEEKQEEFKRLVVDSDLIRFEKGERMVNKPLINGGNNEE